MADNNRIGEIAKTSLDSIRSMLDANTIVGDPIETASGTTALGKGLFVVRMDYAAKKEVSNKPNNFGGGGGTGLTVTPVAFLVVQADGNVNILNVNAGSSSTAPADSVAQVVGFLERSPDLLERIKGVFAKKGEENKI